MFDEQYLIRVESIVKDVFPSFFDITAIPNTDSVMIKFNTPTVTSNTENMNSFVQTVIIRLMKLLEWYRTNHNQQLEGIEDNAFYKTFKKYARVFEEMFYEVPDVFTYIEYCIGLVATGAVNKDSVSFDNMWEALSDSSLYYGKQDIAYRLYHAYCIAMIEYIKDLKESFNEHYINTDEVDYATKLIIDETYDETVEIINAISAVKDIVLH